LQKNGRNMAGFQWTEKAKIAAMSLADGKTRAEAAAIAAIGERTLYRWLLDPTFSEEVDRLTLMIGIATRAERMRLIKRLVAQRTKDDVIESKADVLDWLKFAQSETTGAVNDLAESIAIAITGDHRAQG
jgi:hypothetical protein